MSRLNITVYKRETEMSIVQCPRNSKSVFFFLFLHALSKFFSLATKN